MKDNIRKKLREGLEDKYISVEFLKGLLKNTNKSLAKKFLNKWISNGVQGKTKLSSKEYNLLQIIKSGGIIPQNFTTKN